MQDSNATVMEKMLKPLSNLKERIHLLLNEWEDHSCLQWILNLIEMLLDLPMTTPLSKVLSVSNVSYLDCT